MKRTFLTLIVVLNAILVFGGLCHADFTITRITSNSYEDAFPQTKGYFVVWQGYVDGDWEIFLYNVARGESKRITRNSYNDMSPQTDGEYVAWVGFNREGGEIFLYYIGDGKITKITNDNDLDGPPQIANGRVVWTSHKVTDSVEPGEILLYEIGTATLTSLSTSVDPDGSLDDSFPRINDTEVVWVQTGEDGNTTLFIHDFAGTTEPAPEGYVWRDTPQRDGNTTVLTRHDGSDKEIFIYNSTSREYLQITNNNREDQYPSISGDHIVWVEGEGNASEIYVASSGSAGDGDGGLCFITTAAFGSHTDSHVQVLKDPRDHYWPMGTVRGFLSRFFRIHRGSVSCDCALEDPH